MMGYLANEIRDFQNVPENFLSSNKLDKEKSVFTSMSPKGSYHGIGKEITYCASSRNFDFNNARSMATDQIKKKKQLMGRR